MRVGCKLHRVARSEANSEYLRFTSRPCYAISMYRISSIARTYATVDSVLDIVDALLARIRDEYDLVGVFV
jgi:hypothetical protein